eukprot:3583084-Amphidinium_carterae.1
MSELLWDVTYAESTPVKLARVYWERAAGASLLGLSVLLSELQVDAFGGRVVEEHWVGRSRA